MDEQELNLINAIKAGNVEESINAFVEFMCGGREEAHKMVTLIDTGLLPLLGSEAITTIAALTLKLSKLAVKYEEENKT